MLVPHEEPKKPRKPKEPEKPKEPNKPSKRRARSRPVPVPVSSALLALVNPGAAGVDVHSDMHMVCVPADRDVDPVRQFGANTVDLQEIAAWLKKMPHKNRRVGVHRHLLDSSVRVARI